jgi:hypothetical protein
MAVLRALFVAIVAASLAMPPVAAADLGAGSSHEHAAATHAECCAPGQQCDKPAKGECGHDAACLLKCASASAAVTAPPTVTFKRLALSRSGLLAETVTGLSTNPPLPPPRV